MPGSNLIVGLISTIVGGVVAAVTVFGLVSSLTGADGNPANVDQPVVNYGATE